MSSIEPTEEQWAALGGLDVDGPVVMLNLLRYRERARYPADSDAEPCSGREAYGRYSAAVTEHLLSVGARPLWVGTAQAMVIAPEGERWDDLFLVAYPSREAFAKMFSSPAYQAIAVHRTAALADSRLVMAKGQLLPGG